jgi:hypothetical protein
MTKKQVRGCLSAKVFILERVWLFRKRNRQLAAYLKFIFLTIQIYGCLNSTGLCKTGRKNRDWREGNQGMEIKEVTWGERK